VACFQTKNPNLGKFRRALDWKMFIFVIAIWNILWRLGIFYDHLVHFVLIWYIFSGFGSLYQEKSGNPEVVHILGLTVKVKKLIRK
jgi:predicted membrane protein